MNNDIPNVRSEGVRPQIGMMFSPFYFIFHGSSPTEYWATETLYFALHLRELHGHSRSQCKAQWAGRLTETLTAIYQENWYWFTTGTFYHAFSLKRTLTLNTLQRRISSSWLNVHLVTLAGDNGHQGGSRQGFKRTKPHHWWQKSKR